MLATFINAGAIIAGSALGLLLKGRLSQRFSKFIMQGIALCVMMIGISMALKGSDVLGMVVCVGVGAVIGEALRIEDRLDRLGEWLRGKVERKAQSGQSTFTEAFVSATILFCVGAMAIVGSLEAGFTGSMTTLLAKSTIDGITSIVFAASLGVGVAFASVPVLLYQGAITLLAVVLRPLLPDATIALMSATGGLLVLAIGMRMLGFVQIKVSNFLPAIFLPIAYVPLKALLGTLF